MVINHFAEGTTLIPIALNSSACFFQYSSLSFGVMASSRFWAWRFHERTFAIAFRSASLISFCSGVIFQYLRWGAKTDLPKTLTQVDKSGAYHCLGLHDMALIKAYHKIKIIDSGDCDMKCIGSVLFRDYPFFALSLRGLSSLITACEV
jgi:hypothetical protein